MRNNSIKIDKQNIRGGDKVIEDAKNIKRIIESDESSSLNAVIDGGSDNLIVNIIKGRISGHTVQRLQKEQGKCEFIFESGSKQIKISTI